jgi:hypothetical protein
MQRQVDMASSRLRNGFLKVKERSRRDARMLEIVKKGKLPFVPAVMSWLSRKTNKPSTRITREDLKKILSEPESSAPTKGGRSKAKDKG